MSAIPRKLTAQDAVSIRTRRAAGAAVDSLAAMFAVSPSMISMIAVGKSWPTAGGPITRSVDRSLTDAERLWLYVDRSAGPAACWPWTRGDNGSGYGVLTVGSSKDGSRRQVLTHRFAYELTRGPIPVGLFIRHKVCGNPPCCNPAHLEPGTQKQNMADMIAMDRGARGERHYAAQLSDATATEIMRRRAAGERGRDLAAEFGVSQSLVTMLCRRKIWRHLDGPETHRKRGGRRPRPVNPLAIATAIVNAAEVLR